MAFWALSAGAIGACAATAAQAHGFGQRYDLPIPLSFYLIGAAVTVVVSFVIVGLFVRKVARSSEYPRLDLQTYPLGRLVSGPNAALVLKLLALGVFIIIIMAGLRGDQNPYKNIAPTMVWIVGWVGLAYLSAFVGDLWVVLNPWRTIFSRLKRSTVGSPNDPTSLCACLTRMLSVSGRRLPC